MHQPTISEPPKTIVDICFPLFKLSHEYQQGRLNLDGQALQSTIITEFFDVELQLKQAGFADAIGIEVKFVMSAFVDEMVLKIGDERAVAWAAETLQMRFFSENIGGEKFFDRLSYLQQFSDRRFDLLELYYWCLVLGYEGQYSGPHKASDLQLISENLRNILYPNQIEKYRAMDCSRMSMNIKPSFHHDYLRNMTTKTVVVAIAIGGTMIYGIETAIMEYLLSGLQLLSRMLV